MARLACAKIRHQRYLQCMKKITLALGFGISSEDEVMLVFLFAAPQSMAAYDRHIAPTTLPGVLPDSYFYAEFGGSTFGRCEDSKSHTS